MTLCVECETCGREFDCDGSWETERHDGYGTRREWFPVGDAVCKACRGEGRCEGTFLSDARGRYLEAVPCGKPGRTRLFVEADGGKSHLGVRCDRCAAWYAEDDE